MVYYGATICLNGHVLDRYRASTQKYCSMCGKETYSLCVNCKTPIRGLSKIEGPIINTNRIYKKPSYCHNCSSPFPWTQKILDNAIELVSLDDELDAHSKELIKNAIPELLIDSPVTPVAITKYQKGISKSGQLLKNTMRQLLVDVVSETTKKILFP